MLCPLLVHCTNISGNLFIGISMTPAGTIMAINWRTKLITELDMEGKVVKQFTSPELQQPMCIAVNSKSDVIIADNTAECVFIFDNTGRCVLYVCRLSIFFVRGAESFRMQCL